MAAEDPGRGVEWALLAIDSLAANRMLESYPEWAALGWARLALARWRAGDLAGAEKDVEQSDRDARRASRYREADDYPESWQAESGRVAAALDWHQGRRHEGLDLAEDLPAEYRELGSADLHKALALRAELRAACADLDAGPPSAASESGGETPDSMLRSAPPGPTEGLNPGVDARSVSGPGKEGLGRSSRRRCELWGEALADVEELRRLRAAAPAAERLADFRLWLRILVLIGDRAEMVVALPEARSAAAGLGDGAAPLVPWLEGHCATDAQRKEALWRQARERFAALGDDLWVARATLDRARLGLSEGRQREVAALASELVAKLGAMATGSEDLAALKALARAATPVAAVTGKDLERAEWVLKPLEWRRRAGRALSLAL